MSSSDAKRLLKDLKTNTDMAKKLSTMASTDESLKYIQSQGYDVTMVEIARAEHSGAQALTDEQLEAAAGGGFCVQTYGTTLCTPG